MWCQMLTNGTLYDPLTPWSVDVTEVTCVTYVLCFMLLSAVFHHSDFCLTEKGKGSTNVSADPATSISHPYN